MVWCIIAFITCLVQIFGAISSLSAPVRPGVETAVGTIVHPSAQIKLIVYGIGLALTVGIWLGKRWAWWFVTGQLVFFLMNDVKVLTELGAIYDMMAAKGIRPNHSLSHVQGYFTGRVFGQVLALLYLNLEGVRDFFNLSHVPWRTIILIYALVALAGLASTFLIGIVITGP
jgi:hypothetical protein